MKRLPMAAFFVQNGLRTLLLVRIHLLGGNTEIRVLSLPGGLRHTADHPHFLLGEGKIENILVAFHVRFGGSLGDRDDAFLRQETQADLGRAFSVFFRQRI